MKVSQGTRWCTEVFMFGVCLWGAVTATAQSPEEAGGYTAPRTADGHPDLQGVWQVLNTAAWDIQDHSAPRGVPAGRGVVVGNEIPYQPWAAELADLHFDEHNGPPATIELIDPVTRGQMDGLPRINYRGAMQVLQTPDQVIMMNEYNHQYRVIPIDGSPHIGSDIKLWNGDSRGHWEGNTLVVDVTNFNGHTWFDIVGNFTSDTMTLEERWTFVSPDRIDYLVTITDPRVYTRPWTMLVNHGRREDYEHWESAVHEGNNAVEVMLGAPHDFRKSRW